MTAIDFPLEAEEAAKQEFIFPAFIVRRAGGVYLDMRALSLATGGLELFVDRLFGEGMFFAGLDYAALQRLLYDPDWLSAMQNKTVEARIADKISEFKVERKALYHELRLLDDGKRAEYFFEPVSLTESYQVPVYGEPDEQGITPLIDHATKTRLVPAKLDFDEFVADMWLKGLKYGLDVNAIRAAIASSASSRITIAYHLAPTPGHDAEILEVCPDLHRDNSPRILLSGKADLRVFKNRFPQIGKGKRLLKKIPRVLGKPGYKVTGEVIEPSMPSDLDLYQLASLGTAVVQEKDGEYIAATMDGFLTIDIKSNLISVAEKIETDSGISIRTTGDLVLDVDEFVEHGEVQEGRRVEGKHMTFLADVFGTIISNGGNIFIAGCLSGGRAVSAGGNVTLGSNVSRSVILAHEGMVTVHYCEHSTLIGRIVNVEHAVNCEIIADEVNVELSEGCMIAAEQVRIGCAGERRGKETLVTLLIPDLTDIDGKIVELKKRIAEDKENNAKKIRELEALKADQDFAKYMTLHERIKSGAIKLTAEHAINWRKMVEKNAKSSAQYVKLRTELAVLAASVKDAGAELFKVVAEREALGAGIGCEIHNLNGQTTGQTMKCPNGADFFSGKTANDIRTLLHKMDSHKARIFSEDEGSINWKYHKSIS